MSTRVELSGVSVRRRFALGSTYVATVKGSGTMVLASVLDAEPDPQPVAMEDSTTHAEQRGVHSRVLIRPSNLFTPTATYVGRGINIMEV
jgi:hypothetical protein